MPVRRSGLCDVMVGRLVELGQLEERFAAVAVGAPAVAVVTGEPGVGKTRLVAEFLARRPAQTTLVVTAEERLSERPFGALIAALEPAVTDWKEVPAGLPPSVSDLVAPVAPALVTGGTAPVTGDELRRAAVGLLRYLLTLVGSPAVAVFEDLQWADPETLATFGALALLPGVPVMVVGTCRPPSPATGRLIDVLAALERRTRVEHVAIADLDREQVAELLAAVYGRPIPLRSVEAVYERCGGNPFFIEELLAGAGRRSPEELADVALPVSVTEAVLRHFDVLPAGLRSVAGAAAILGQRIPFDLLATLTSLSEGGLLEALSGLVRAGILAETGPDVFTFRHALTRETVAGQLLSRSRRRLHERALAALAATPSPDWPAIAYHAAGAGRPDEVVRATRAGAAEQLAAGATEVALRLAETGLAHDPGGVELVELAARAAAAAGLPSTAVEYGRRWVTLTGGAADPRARLAALVFSAHILGQTGDFAGEQKAVADAVTLAEALGPSPELARAYALPAHAAHRRHDPSAALDWGRRGLAVVAGAGAGAAPVRPDLLATIAGARGCGATEEELQEVAADLADAADAAEACGEPVVALRALRSLRVMQGRVWSADEGFAVLDRMDALCRQWGRQDWQGEVVRLRAAFLAERIGDLPAAKAVLSKLAHDEVLVDVARAQTTTFIAAQLAIAAGDPEAAAFVERARQQAARSRHPYEIVWANALTAELAISRKDRPAMEGALRALAGVVDWPGCPWVWAFHCDHWFSALVGALAAALPAATVRALIAEADLPAHVGHVHNDPAWPDHLDAALLEADGDHSAALVCYDRALTAAGRRRWVVEAADVQQGRARCLLALGRTPEARAAAGEAVALLARRPGPGQAAAARLARRLSDGAGPRSDGILSAREAEVAALVAEGLSNADVARRLYISPRTVGVHVSHILTKLGMTSRVEIAAWAVRSGLTS